MVRKDHTNEDIDAQEFMPDGGFIPDDGHTESEHGRHANMTEDSAPENDNSAEMAALREADEWKDRYMRLQAEFDNYRKRTLREKNDLMSFGGEEVIKALLPVLDDTDRALEAMKKTEDVESVRTGIELVSKKLRDTLAGRGLSEIDAMGSDLDTDLHEAVAKFPGDKKQKGKVIDVVQKGYKLRDKVVRHAKCVVGE